MTQSAKQSLCPQEEGFPILASFLRKNQRALKLSTLQCLDMVVRNYSEYSMSQLYTLKVLVSQLCLCVAARKIVRCSVLGPVRDVA